eukprot:126736_1
MADDQFEHPNDWEDVEELDSYNTRLHSNNQHENTSQDDNKSNEWICHQCNYPNDRHLAITQNDCGCSNCGAELIVNNDFIKQEEKKYDIEVAINTENDEAIAKSLQVLEAQTESKIAHHMNQTAGLKNHRVFELIHKMNHPLMINKMGNKAASTLILPKNTTSKLLPMDNINKLIEHKMDGNPNNDYAENIQRYRPSLFNGSYGSYCYRDYESYIALAIQKRYIGYHKFDDGIITVATVIQQRENSMDLQCNLAGPEGSNFRKPFVVMINDDKLCEFSTKNIENSHQSLWEKWMIILRAKCKYNLKFEKHVFQTMMNSVQNHPQILNTFRYDNWKTSLQDKSYDDVIKSLLSYILSPLCENRYDNKENVNIFKKCQYYLSMAFIEKQLKNDDSALEILTNDVHVVDTNDKANKICSLLP